MEGEESDQGVAQVRCLALRLDGMRTTSACHPLNEGVLRHGGGGGEAERKRKGFSEKHEGPKMKPTERQNMPREHQIGIKMEDLNIRSKVSGPRWSPGHPLYESKG